LDRPTWLLPDLERFSIFIEMQDYPKVNKGQVVLTRALVATGHVVDESLNLVLSDSQVMYTVFNDHETAITFAKKIIEDRNDIECVICDENRSLLNYFTIDNLSRNYD
jgi:hypothetical protein